MPIEPSLVKIPSGAVSLGVPECPENYSMMHRWRTHQMHEIGEFSIAKYPVTRAEYACFLADTCHEKPIDWNDPVLNDPRKPACGVSAEDADAYCRWLGGVTGKPYRLPSCHEWEKAARGGLLGKRFPWGDEAPEGRCCYGRSEADGPLPVGAFPPNGYSLYDMVGNIWQWLADLYVEIADDKPINTPTGKDGRINRVLVGGSFMTGKTDSLWVAYRHEDPPDLRHRCLGFRLAL